MAVLTIRDVDDELKAKLRIRAAEHGRSMEAEVRAILAAALTETDVETGLGTWIRQRFSDVDDASFGPPARSDRPRPAELPE